MTPLFITLEGIDGCGKTTQAALLADALSHAGVDVLSLREPGGVAISEKIRAILLDPANAEMGDTCELLLYEAARAQLVHQVIAPALAAGRTVVCDRFYDSTTAYQAYAAGLDPARVGAANELAVDGCHPDLTLVFELPVEGGSPRGRAERLPRSRGGQGACLPATRGRGLSRHRRRGTRARAPDRCRGNPG